MNINKFTQKSIEAIQELEKLAYEFGNQEMDQEHLVYALVNQSDGLISKMIEKMEIQKEYFLLQSFAFLYPYRKVRRHVMSLLLLLHG